MTEIYNDSFVLEKRKARVAISPTCNLSCKYCDNGAARSDERTGAMEDFRSTSLETGVIGTSDYIELMKTLRSAGYTGIVLTGGEPTINPDWSNIVIGAKQIGFESVCLTTNGSLLDQYIDQFGHLPAELDMLTVSLDSFNNETFSDITGAALDRIVNGLKRVKQVNPDLVIKANKVVMKSDLENLELYVSECEGIGAISKVTLLSLICKNPQLKEEREFFESEYVSPQDVMDCLKIYDFAMDKKYEYVASTSVGMVISLVDTSQSIRSNVCDDCPIYCQEGFYTARIATDGTVRSCIDSHNQLPYVEYNKDESYSTLEHKVHTLLRSVGDTAIRDTFSEFCERYELLSAKNTV
ncbi:MAG: radical SAM protein [Candidatus Saccharibacteria bacterium]